MLRFISAIENHKVLSVQTSHSVGVFDDLFIDYKTGKIIGIYINTSPAAVLEKIPFIGSYLSPQSKHIILSPNIIEWSNAIYIQSFDAIIQIDEMIRYKDQLNDDYSIFGLKVYTKKGIYLGTVNDVMIETVTMTLRKIIVSKQGLIKRAQYDIPMAYVYKITSQKVIVNDISRKIQEAKKAQRRGKGKNPQAKKQPAFSSNAQK